MINILNQFNKNYQMKTIKTYIQAKRRKFSNNGGGLGSWGWVVVDFLNFFLVVLGVLVLVLLVLLAVVAVVLVLVLSVSSAVKAVKSLLANKLIFCMRCSIPLP